VRIIGDAMSVVWFSSVIRSIESNEAARLPSMDLDKSSAIPFSGWRPFVQAGVWVDLEQPAKIAAIGVKIQRGVTMHGFALNVTMDLAPFQLVTPCGIQGCRVTSMADILRHDVQLTHVRRRMAEIFAELFDIEWTEWIRDGQPCNHDDRDSSRSTSTREFTDESEE